MGGQVEGRFLGLGKIGACLGACYNFLVSVLRLHPPELIIIPLGGQIFQAQLPQYIVPVQRHGHLAQVCTLLHNGLQKQEHLLPLGVVLQHHGTLHHQLLDHLGHGVDIGKIPQLFSVEASVFVLGQHLPQDVPLKQGDHTDLGPLQQGDGGGFKPSGGIRLGRLRRMHGLRQGGGLVDGSLQLQDNFLPVIEQDVFRFPLPFVHDGAAD